MSVVLPFDKWDKMQLPFAVDTVTKWLYCSRKVFEANRKKIEAFNAANPNGFKLGHNKYMDMVSSDDILSLNCVAEHEAVNRSV